MRENFKFNRCFFVFTKESISNGRRSNQQLMISNYAYDPRLHLQPMNSMTLKLIY